jgi:mono/diheme cytochrome c family protein
MDPVTSRSGRRRALRGCAWLAALGALVLGLAHDTEAHKPVTSPYDYNRDVYPMLRDHCGQCHSDGGAGPMSLMTYNDAVSWAESIRDELTEGRMPPWPVDPDSRPVKGGQPISSHDLDAIVTWASGGTPHDWTYSNKLVPKFASKKGWKLGPPDLLVPMGAPHSVAANTLEETSDFSLTAPTTEVKWIKAADLLPGTATIVRSATISVENGPVLARWEPAADVIAAPAGTAFQLPAGAKIHLQIHYKKHYDQQQNAIADKSTVGLYFTAAPIGGHGIDSLDVAATAPASDPTAAQTFSAPMKAAGRILALSPILDRAYASLEINAVLAGGKRMPVLKLKGPRPQWCYRYWLQEPVEAAAGTVLEIKATPLGDYTDELKTTAKAPLHVEFAYAQE